MDFYIYRAANATGPAVCLNARNPYRSKVAAKRAAETMIHQARSVGEAPTSLIIVLNGKPVDHVDP